MAAQKAFPPEPPGTGVDVAWLSDEQQEAWRVMVAVPARLAGRLDAELQAAHDISLRDYEVLVHLSEAPGAALRMVELADRLVVSPSGLTRRLDGLVRDGLVRRQACLSDRRGTLAVLSEAGWAVLEDAAPTHVASVRRYVFDTLSPTQLEQFTASLRLMSAALEAHGRGAGAGGQDGGPGGGPGGGPDDGPGGGPGGGQDGGPGGGQAADRAAATHRPRPDSPTSNLAGAGAGAGSRGQAGAVSSATCR